jgi:membrane AbrB-like protein
MWLVITIFIGIIGGLIGIKAKVPAGAIVGSLVAVIIFNLLTGKAVFPQEFKVITQIGTGAYIGARIRRKDVIELKRVIKPAIILTVTMSIFNIVVSIFLSNNTSLDLVTALFATAPAGVADMTLISVDFGADSSKVAALQLVRLVSVITIMPGLIKYIISKKFSDEIQFLKENTEKYRNEENGDRVKDIKEVMIRAISTLGVGFVFGIISYKLGIPAGAISFSMISCAFYNIKTSKAYMSLNLRRSIQILGGCLIGVQITIEQIISMRELLPSVVVITLGYIILTFTLGFLIKRNSTLDIITALYSSTAGGLTDMTIVASEMGADAPKVATLHFARVVSVVAFYPIIIGALTKFIG